MKRMEERHRWIIEGGVGGFVSEDRGSSKKIFTHLGVVGSVMRSRQLELVVLGGGD